MNQINRANALIFFLAAITLCGCESSAPPPRNKMPELNADFRLDNGCVQPVHDASENFLFQAKIVRMPMNSRAMDFLAVAVPNEANDEAVINLIKAFRPFGSPALSCWYRVNKKGVMIDLASHRTEPLRTDYLLAKPGEFTIPVIILWDKGFISRVSEIKELAAGMAGISFTQTGGINPFPDKKSPADAIINPEPGKLSEFIFNE